MYPNILYARIRCIRTWFVQENANRNLQSALITRNAIDIQDAFSYCCVVRLISYIHDTYIVYLQEASSHLHRNELLVLHRALDVNRTKTCTGNMKD